MLIAIRNYDPNVGMESEDKFNDMMKGIYNLEYESKLNVQLNTRTKIDS